MKYQFDNASNDGATSRSIKSELNECLDNDTPAFVQLLSQT